MTTSQVHDNPHYPTTIINSKSKFTVCMVHQMIQNQSLNQSQNINISKAEDTYIFQKPNISYYSYQPSYEMLIHHKLCNKSLANICVEQEKKQSGMKMKKKCSSFYNNKKRRLSNSKDISEEKAKSPIKNKNFNEFIMNNIKQIIEKPLRESDKQVNFGLDIRKVKKFSTIIRKQQIRIKLKSTIKKTINPVLSNDDQQLMKGATLEERLLITQSDKINTSPEKQQIIDPYDKMFVEGRSLKTRSFQVSKQFPLKIQKYESKYSKIKYIKMKNCLNIILSSFDYFLDHPLNVLNQQKKRFFNKTAIIQHRKSSLSTEQEDQKFKKITPKYLYFIGYGNNAELVRSIFKKRSWWAQTSDIQLANVIWTQNKSKKTINKINTYYTQELIKEKSGSEQLKTRQNIRINKMSIYSSLIQKSLQKSIKQKDTIIPNLFHPKHQKSSNHYLLQDDNNPPKIKSWTKPYIIHNHYQRNYMFGNKNALYLNLSKYYQYVNQDVSDIIPLTYYIQQDKKSQMQAFDMKYEELRHKNMVWILKPGENTNRGQRIVVVKDIQQIKNKLKVQKKLIVQSYIKNLFLYQGRKFDIRTYMLALTINGRLKFYFYEEGYFRTSSQPFNLTDLNDKYIHLTNDAIQKNSQHYGKYEDGNKLSYNEFQRYLDNRCVKNSYRVGDLHNQMKKITIEAVKATYLNFQCRNRFSFQLFGLDFIVNSHFKPYLIEINTNPCLELSSNILERLVPRMLQNLFRLSVDPLFRPKEISKIETYYLYDQSFLTRNKYHLIFDAKYDRDELWQLYYTTTPKNKETISQEQQTPQ